METGHVRGESPSPKTLAVRCIQDTIISRISIIISSNKKSINVLNDSPREVRFLFLPRRSSRENANNNAEQENGYRMNAESHHGLI